MFKSTRNENLKLDSATAILKGIADDGGLFVPEEFKDKSNLVGNFLPYNQIAEEILNSFFPEFEFGDEIKKIYGAFDVENATKIEKVGNRYVLELFHGPTAAFKDFALQALPILIKKSKEKTNYKKRTLILTATSGDTGKAALEGFANYDDVDSGIDIAVIYPSDGVSRIQKKQMKTQEGRNVLVLGIEGDFDDAQRTVKKAFLNEEFKKELAKNNIELSSANSINIGRLVPQVAYYFFAYNELVKNKEIENGEKISFCVPTGNFGDILAGFYAKKMGLPVDKLICASNDNNVLYDFFTTGEYNRNRELIKTHSPSMDIIVSSNLERFLYHCLENSDKVSFYMKELEEKGFYKLSDEDFIKVKNNGISSNYSDEEKSYKEIKRVFETENYLLDTHTAIAFEVAKNEGGKVVILSTASPYKFASSVCDAIGFSYKSEEEAINILNDKTNASTPKGIVNILDKKELHNEVIKTDNFEDKVLDWVNSAKFEVRVPATSANIGPGFDAVGLALSLYSYFRVEATDISFDNNIEDIEFIFEGVDDEFANKDNLVFQSYLFAAKEINAKRVPKKLRVKSKNDIPISRGLGSSATCVLTGVLIALEVEKSIYDKKRLLDISNKYEGHPDNVAPAIYGGMRASIQKNSQVYSLPVKLFNDLHFCTLVPNYRFSTEVARSVLPEKVSLKDAVFNIANMAFLVSAFENREYDFLKFALDDKLHQPYRIPQMQGLSRVFEVAKAAKGVYLSGAGPTVMIIDTDFEKVENLLQPLKSELDFELYDLKVDFEGIKIFG